MKVLFLAHSFPRFAADPVGSFVLRLAVALRESGVTVQVVAPAAAGVPPTEELEGIVVHRFRYAPRAMETLAYGGTMQDQVRDSWSGKTALAMMLWANAAKVVSVGRAFRPDLLHAHWWFPGGLAAAIARPFLGVPFVTTLHGSDLKLARKPGLPRMLARGVLRRAAAVTTVSRFLSQGLSEVVPGVSPVVAPMPVVAELFHSGGERERNRLLYVGKLNEQKGINHVLRALGLMKQRAMLDVVVGVGSDESASKSLAASLGVGDRIRWFPLLSQSQLAEVYRRVTALVVPSVEEGLGLVAVEAHLSETPVVAFDSGGLPDVVTPGTGFLVRPGRADLLAAALDGILTAPDHGASLGAAGRAHALATFSPAAVAARYRDVYASALRSAMT